MNAPYFESSVFTHYGVNEVFENVIRVALAARRQQRFWVTNLRNVKRPDLQHPFCPPRPRTPVVTIVPTEFKNDLQQLLASQSFADAVIIFDNCKFFVHRILLTAGSSFFRRLFAMDLMSSGIQNRNRFEVSKNHISFQTKPVTDKISITVTRSDEDDSGTSLMSGSIGSSMSSHLTRSASDSSISSSVHDSLTSNSNEADCFAKERFNAFFKGINRNNRNMTEKSVEENAIQISTLNRLSNLKTTAALITSAAVSCITRPSSITSSSSTFSSVVSASSCRSSLSANSSSKVKGPLLSFSRRKSLSWQDLHVLDDPSLSGSRVWRKYLPVRRELTLDESLIFASIGLDFMDQFDDYQSQRKKSERVIAILKVRPNSLITEEAMKVCLHYLYGGGIDKEMSTTLMEEVLDLSELLEMTELTQLMQKRLKDQSDLMSVAQDDANSYDAFIEKLQQRLHSVGLQDETFTGKHFILHNMTDG